VAIAERNVKMADVKTPGTAAADRPNGGERGPSIRTDGLSAKENRGKRAPQSGSGVVVGSGASAGGGGGAEDFDSDPAGGGGHQE
jgi:hypothetical protein